MGRVEDLRMHCVWGRAITDNMALYPAYCGKCVQAGSDPSPMCMLQVVMVPDPNLEAGLRGRAQMELGSLAEFDPAAWGLPPYTLA